MLLCIFTNNVFLAIAGAPWLTCHQSATDPLTVMERQRTLGPSASWSTKPLSENCQSLTGRSK